MLAQAIQESQGVDADAQNQKRKGSYDRTTEENRQTRKVDIGGRGSQDPIDPAGVPLVGTALGVVMRKAGAPNAGYPSGAQVRALRLAPPHPFAVFSFSPLYHPLRSSFVFLFRLPCKVLFWSAGIRPICLC